MTTATSAPALRFSGVTKRFPGGTTALADADLEVSPGEFVSVVGPSGCGKSTLLRIASGLDDVSEGTVDVGANGSATSSRTRPCCRGARSRRTSSCSPSWRRWTRAERGRRVTEAIDLVGLTGFEKHLPHQLSGGMRMRASLARSLVLDPDVFLFDEPFGALDEITRERLNDELLRLFELRAVRGAVHHPLGDRGGVPVHPGGGDERAAGPDHRRHRRPVRLSAHARAALHAGVRRACAARFPGT